MENKFLPQKKYEAYEMATIIERFYAFSSENRSFDYGTGERYYTREVHMLSYIADHPGSSPSEIAKDWHQTRGATSQMLRKLMDRGLVRTQQDENDRRVSYLYVTDKGKELDQKHKEFDSVNIGKFLKQLRAEYTEEELQLVFSVLERWLNIFMANDGSETI